MSFIVISPLSRIAEAAARHNACSMISLLAEGQAFHRPALLPAERHLTLGLNDIAIETEALILPQAAHVASLVEFTRRWDRQAPLLIHCWMGISRSPAAAMVAALALHPDQEDAVLVRRLRAASPSATPNRRLIAIGDEMLGRGGALISAVAALGRGAEASEGVPFTLALAPEARGSGGHG